MEDKQLTEEELEKMGTVPSDEEQAMIQEALENARGPDGQYEIEVVDDDEIQEFTEEELAEGATQPRRSAVMDIRTDEEKRKAQRLFELANKRNPVPRGHRGQIKVKRNAKRNIQKASRKANRGN